MSRPKLDDGVGSVEAPNLATGNSRHQFKGAWSAGFDAILIDHDVGSATCKFFIQDHVCSTARRGIVDARGGIVDARRAYRACLRLTASTRECQNRSWATSTRMRFMPMIL